MEEGVKVADWLQDQIREEAEMYLQQGLTVEAIAKATHQSYAKVRRHFKVVAHQFDPELGAALDAKCAENSITRSKKGGDTFRSQFESDKRRRGR